MVSGDRVSRKELSAITQIAWLDEAGHRLAMKHSCEFQQRYKQPKYVTRMNSKNTLIPVLRGSLTATH